MAQLRQDYDKFQAADAEIADIITYQAGDVVITYQQEIDRHIFAITDELISSARVLETALLQQLEAVIRQAPGLLNGDLNTFIFINHLYLLL